jgi:hypothetical protein
MLGIPARPKLQALLSWFGRNPLIPNLWSRKQADPARYLPDKGVIARLPADLSFLCRQPFH